MWYKCASRRRDKKAWKGYFFSSKEYDYQASDFNAMSGLAGHIDDKNNLPRKKNMQKLVKLHRPTPINLHVKNYFWHETESRKSQQKVHLETDF